MVPTYDSAESSPAATICGQRVVPVVGLRASPARERGLTVVDVVVVLAVIAFLVFVATREFPRYERHAPPPTAAS